MNMKDYKELIDRVKNKDDEAFNIILEDHYRMIYKIIYNQNLEKGDYLIDIDSLYQEGCLALYSAIFSYEMDRGMSFSSYAYMVIRTKITTYIRDNYKRIERDYYSIDNVEGIDYRIMMTNLCVSENPVEYHKEREFENKINKFVSKLSDEDKQIMEMRSDNLSYKQIAERLKIKTKRVDNRIRILRKKLRSYLDEDNKNDYYY